MEAVIFIGIQATGKSTFYYQQFFLTHVRINLDMLKTRHREKRLIETCMQIGQPFVIDNTNPTIQDRERYIQAAKEKDFKVSAYYKDAHKFEAPFDIRFRDHMIATVEHLMNCGFCVIYGYTESDEISLLFHRSEHSFGRKLRKFESILAGEASSKFSLLLNDLAAFDCRISQLPTVDLVIDYFRWRNEDASRNALNAHCYWALRKNGENIKSATNKLLKLSVAEKMSFYFNRRKSTSINYPIGKSAALDSIGKPTLKRQSIQRQKRLFKLQEDESKLIWICQ